MDITEALEVVVNNNNLESADMRDVMRQIMTGQATPSQIGGFLVARLPLQITRNILAATLILASIKLFNG